MRFGIPLALAALLAIGNAAPERTLDAIEFKISSWGKPLSAWRVEASGAARATRSKGPGLGSYRLVTTRFDVGKQGFAELRATLAAAEDAASDGPECGRRVTDFPYGEVVWTGGDERATLRFDLGCQNSALAPIHRALADADAQMEKWGKKGEVIEDKEGHS